MRFILIIDDTYSGREIIDAIRLRTTNNEQIQNKCVLDTYIIHNSLPLDSDTKILLQMLMKEKHRAPVIVDAKVAKFYPEILKMQQSVVMFMHETDITRDPDEYNLFNEAIAASHGARIDYVHGEFHESENDKHLSVVDIAEHMITPEYYVYLSQIYKAEHEKYPFILLPRCVHNDANYESELIELFDSRNEYVAQVGLASSKVSDNTYDDIKLNAEHCDTAIHFFGDERLNPSKVSITQKSV